MVMMMMMRRRRMSFMMMMMMMTSVKLPLLQNLLNMSITTLSFSSGLFQLFCSVCKRG